MIASIATPSSSVMNSYDTTFRAWAPQEWPRFWRMPVTRTEVHLIYGVIKSGGLFDINLADRGLFAKTVSELTRVQRTLR